MSDPQVCPYCNKVFMTRGCEPDKAIEWEGLTPSAARDSLIGKLCAILRLARGEIVEYAEAVGYDIEAGVKTKDDEAVILVQIDKALKEAGDGR